MSKRRNKYQKSQTPDTNSPSSSFNLTATQSYNTDTQRPVVVLDTNVFLDAMNAEYKKERATKTEQAAYHVLSYALTEATVRFTQKTWDELQLVMERPNWAVDTPTGPRHRQDYLLSLLQQPAIQFVAPGPLYQACKNDHQDNKFLKAASSEDGAFALISSDMDLVSMRRVRQTSIMRPKEFVRRVIGASLSELGYPAPLIFKEIPKEQENKANPYPHTEQPAEPVSEIWAAALKNRKQTKNRTRHAQKRLPQNLRRELGEETISDLEQQSQSIRRQVKGEKKKEPPAPTDNREAASPAHTNKKAAGTRTGTNTKHTKRGKSTSPKKQRHLSPLAVSREMGFLNSAPSTSETPIGTRPHKEGAASTTTGSPQKRRRTPELS